MNSIVLPKSKMGFFLFIPCLVLSKSSKTFRYRNTKISTFVEICFFGKIKSYEYFEKYLGLLTETILFRKHNSFPNYPEIFSNFAAAENDQNCGIWFARAQSAEIFEHLVLRMAETVVNGRKHGQFVIKQGRCLEFFCHV